MNSNKMGFDDVGDYFVLTAGYSELGGLVNKNREGLLFLSLGEGLYRLANVEETLAFSDLHPVLSIK